jgi:antitoxin ParD1/3/4
MKTIADIERLSIALPSPMADTVRKAVSDGEYASASEVVRDALRLWQQRPHLHAADADVTRRRWDEGKASGRAGPLDIKRVLAEERAAFKGARRLRD